MKLIPFIVRNKKFFIILFAVFILLYSFILYGRYKILQKEDILKTALPIYSIKETPYILVKQQSTTGPVWVEVNSLGIKTNECALVGVDPYADLKLSIDFQFGNNTFILYVEKVEEYYDEELGYSYPKYYVKNNWDILYPVKRDPERMFFLAPYITSGDTYTYTEED